MCHINESPVLLKLNPVAGKNNEVKLNLKNVYLDRYVHELTLSSFDQLPINMYESVIDVEDGKVRTALTYDTLLFRYTVGY
jgi:hypothetical protein